MSASHAPTRVLVAAATVFALAQGSVLDATPRMAAGGNHHSIFVDPATGAVMVVGENELGQLGQGDALGLVRTHTEAVKVDGPWKLPVRDVAADMNACIVVDAEGAVFTWGFNQHGQLGRATSATIETKVGRVEGLPEMVDAEGGAAHVVAIAADGSVWAWGKNNLGQLGLGEGAPEVVAAPARVEGLPPMADVALGIAHAVALARDGSVWAWGSNGDGQVGPAAVGQRSVVRPVRVDGIAGAIAVGAGSFVSYASTPGALYGWGENTYGQVPGSSEPGPSTPVSIPGFAEGDRVVSIAGGARYGHALLADGTLRAWGVNGPAGQFGMGVKDREAKVRHPVRVVEGMPALVSIHTATNHSMAVTREGRVIGWGSNSNGRLAQDAKDGDKLITAYPAPVVLAAAP